MSDELERVWKEGGRGTIQALAPQCPGKTEETHTVLSEHTVGPYSVNLLLPTNSNCVLTCISNARHRTKAK